MPIKSKVQITKMKKAAKHAAHVHSLLSQQICAGASELEIEKFIAKHISEFSFPTLVGSGSRSTLIHAHPTKKIIRKNDLIVVDLGARLNGYCSDMTRTYSASGKMTKEQSEIYQIVLKAQSRAIKAVRVGTTLQQIHQVVLKCFEQELTKLKITTKVESLFPHRTSHWIGKEVHEKSAYFDEQGKAIELKAGMIFTIEPGLYFHPKFNIKKYSGIGVRIEDMVLVTNNGCEVLTQADIA